MTKTPTPTPTSAYDQEFARVSEEIAELKNKLEEQEQRVSLLEKFMRSLREFFAGLFN
jgi:predicted RNase H-like nuclease (RuvC/YqgF family)